MVSSPKPANWPPTESTTRVLPRAHPRVELNPTRDGAARAPATKPIGSTSTNQADAPRSSRRPCARPKHSWFSHFVILLQLTQSFCDLISNFFVHWTQPFFATVLNHFSIDIVLNHFVILLYWTQPFYYSAQSFCYFATITSVILWFCYNYLSYFVILSVIFYTLNSAIFTTGLNHFSIATVLSHFVIMLY
jgi:hypothetical protein